MAKENRGTKRRAIGRRVWIDAGDGSPVAECLLGNMSDSGAKLMLGAPRELPDNFTLLLSEDGRVARQCRVVWVSGNEIGVAFTARRAGVPAGAD